MRATLHIYKAIELSLYTLKVEKLWINNALWKLPNLPRETKLVNNRKYREQTTHFLDLDLDLNDQKNRRCFWKWFNYQKKIEIVIKALGQGQTILKHFKWSHLAQNNFYFHAWVKKCHFGNFARNGLFCSQTFHC